MLSAGLRSCALRKGGAFSLAALIVVLLAPAAASARTITLGSDLTGEFTITTTFSGPATVTGTSTADPESSFVSPVDGVVRRWRLIRQNAAETYALRVLRPTGDGSYTAVATSRIQVASTSATSSFPTSLPIQAGDLIGLEALTGSPSPSLVAESVPGAKAIFWDDPDLGDGATRPPMEIADFEFGFNAEVQPAPRVGLVAPASGPAAGGTAVTIAGGDFTGVTGVKFGSTSATSFVVNSEFQITATAPPFAGSGPVDVTVTAAAGTSTTVAGDKFTYLAAASPPAPPGPPAPTPCVVPKLTGKNLRAGRNALAKTECRLGNVAGRRKKAATIVRQNPRPGTLRAPGSAVNVKLG